MYSNNFKSYSMSLFPHQIYALNFIEHLLLCFSLWFLSTLLFFLAFLTSIKLTFVVHVSTFIIRYTISWAFRILSSYLSKVVQDLHIFFRSSNYVSFSFSSFCSLPQPWFHSWPLARCLLFQHRHIWATVSLRQQVRGDRNKMR